MKTAIQRREMIRRITAIASELHRIRVRMEKLNLSDQKKVTPAKGSSSKKSAKKKVTLVGAVITYKGAKAKVIEGKGEKVKVKFLSGSKKGKATLVWRAHAYRLAKAA